MTIDPFTTPAEAEREGRAKQAREFLALAMTPEHLSMWAGNPGQFDYENGVQAVRDALVGQGYALLTVRDELADIAGSLRTLAAAPTAVANVALAVNAVQETLNELGNDVCDVHTAIEGCYEATTSGSVDVAAAVREVGEILEDRLSSLDRPRWWQWRRRAAVRRAIHEQPAQADIEPGESHSLIA